MTKEDILNKYQYFIKRGDGFISLINILEKRDNDTFYYEAITMTKTNTFTSINNGIAKAQVIIDKLEIINPSLYKNIYECIIKLQEKHKQLYNSLI